MSIKPPTREPSEDDKKRERAQAKLLRSYAEVFGTDKKRTEAQKLVMADMEHRGYIHRTTLVATGKDGHSDAQFNASAEGQRLFMLNTKTLIQIGAKALTKDDEEQTTTKRPTIKRQST